MSDKPRERTYPSRVRLANKTQWALRDMLAAAKRARETVEEITPWIKGERVSAKGRYDLARLDRLGELSELINELTLEVAKLERLASDAQIGEYQPMEEKSKPNGPAAGGTARRATESRKVGQL